MERKREEEVVVVDFLQHGYPFDKRPSHVKTAIAQTLGTTNFSLLEIVPRKDVFLQALERLYVGDDKRERVQHINGKLAYRKLTENAKSELPHVVKAQVVEQEARFVDFFNKAQPLNLRVHSLEMLPGIGKKHMKEILAAREEADFVNFADLHKRVPSIGDPINLITNRIMSEMEGLEKLNLFVR